MAGIGATWQNLGTTARQWRGGAMRGADGPFDVIVNHALWRRIEYAARMRSAAWSCKGAEA